MNQSVHAGNTLISDSRNPEVKGQKMPDLNGNIRHEIYDELMIFLANHNGIMPTRLAISRFKIWAFPKVWSELDNTLFTKMKAEGPEKALTTLGFENFPVTVLSESEMPQEKKEKGFFFVPDVVIYGNPGNVCLGMNNPQVARDIIDLISQRNENSSGQNATNLFAHVIGTRLGPDLLLKHIKSLNAYSVEKMTF